MVDTPYNYNKPTLTQYVIKYILESSNPDHWERIDLGEAVLNELISLDCGFEPDDYEWQGLIDALDNLIKDRYKDAIDSGISLAEQSGLEI